MFAGANHWLGSQTMEEVNAVCWSVRDPEILAQLLYCQSPYFDRQCFASDKRELHLREVLHTLLCPFGPDPVFRLSLPLALPPTTHCHDQYTCLHSASRGSSHGHGHSPSSCEALGTSRNDAYDLRVSRNLNSSTSLQHWPPARFQR